MNVVFFYIKKNKQTHKKKTLTTPGTVFVTEWETTTDKYVLLLSVMNIKVSVVLNLNPHLDCSVTLFQYATDRYRSHFLSALNGLIMAKIVYKIFHVTMTSQ